MVPKSQFHIPLLFLVLFFSSTTQSLRFELEPTATKCISEDIHNHAMTVGTYSVVNHNEGHPLPDSHKINVKVTSSFGNNYHQADGVQSGRFAFFASESGNHVACFTVAEHETKVPLTIEFVWKSGVQAKDWSTVAKKGQVDILEQEVKELVEYASDIYKEMSYIREIGDETQALNRTTNDRMFWFSFLSLFVCLSVAGLQLWHLKTFFEKKKLI
ncbi:hypothetical protein Lal_00007336 [Lupinus albus]|uniref:Uncharacterized protein n=1 Tax=Lupinus albus TaxID=3870 RepID=A0A6A4NUP9_LUPAL|nr:hypothetical protein Lalb_Chr16g0385671 [Lupinus albus]KAF1874722.1 hypothetical protein Lal_00007336 [Lupinus albus]